MKRRTLNKYANTLGNVRILNNRPKYYHKCLMAIAKDYNDTTINYWDKQRRELEQAHTSSSDSLRRLVNIMADDVVNTLPPGYVVDINKSLKENFIRLIERVEISGDRNNYGFVRIPYTDYCTSG